MDTAATDVVVRAFLKQISANLSKAASIATAAEHCADKDDIVAAIKLAMDIEDFALTADRMLKAILLIRTELDGETLG